MRFQTTETWDEEQWKEAEPIYHQAFPEHGRKPEAVIRSMFERGLCQLHRAVDGKAAVAMALTGIDRRADAFIIDYIAVSEAHRQRSYGRQMIEYLKTWAKAHGCKGMIIEVEAENSEANLSRIAFWERCGFRLTEGVHHYIWVPEPYRAMVLHFHPEHPLPEDGPTLFRSITAFHSRAYRAK